MLFIGSLFSVFVSKMKEVFLYNRPKKTHTGFVELAGALLHHQIYRQEPASAFLITSPGGVHAESDGLGAVRQTVFNMLFLHKWANEAIIELHPQCVWQFKRSYAKASRPRGNKTS